jgi:chemotaxis signal transduction protein
MKYREFFTFWVGPTVFGVSSPVPFVMYPRKPEFNIPGASPVVLGGFMLAGYRQITVVDLRRLFGVPIERTLMTAMVLVEQDGVVYALMVDSIDTEFHFDRSTEEVDRLESSDVPERARSYVASVVSGYVGGVQKFVYTLDLAKILAPETLMVN